jgi:malonyl-CoA O-methyltransferase
MNPVIDHAIDHAVDKPIINRSIIDKAIDKAAARRAFDAAANGYEAVAVLQREIGNRMLERLGYIRLAPKRVLDLGCGPGVALDGLARRYRGAEIVAVDFALNMLRRARRRGHWLNRPRVICADAEALPLADDSVDLVFSNATLQWVNDLDATFREVLRVLRPGGLMLFSTFGPDTLRELRAAWAAVDQGAHVSPFLDMHDIGDALVRARFADPVMDVERMTLTYADLRGLMRDLKQLGAHNALTGRARGLTGRRRLAALEQAYESQRRGGRLPATYEVVHGHAWVTAKAQPQLATADGVAIPLAAVAGRLRRRSAAGGEP